MFPYSELPNDIVGIILDFIIPPVYKLVDWIDPNKLVDIHLNRNIHVIDYFKMKYNCKTIKELLIIHPQSYYILRLISIICRYSSSIRLLTSMYKISDWIGINLNPNIISLLKNNNNKVCWGYSLHKIIWERYRCYKFIELPRDLNWISLLELFPYGIIDWLSLSCNPNAISILEDNPDKIDWEHLSRNPNAIPILEKNLDRIDWFNLSGNQNAIYILERNIDEIDWDLLSGNPNAIELLEKNSDKINWYNLSSNPNAISLLEKNLDKIDWKRLSSNINAIPILEKNLDRIDWRILSRNPNAISLLEKNFDKINWFWLSENPNAIGLLEKNKDKIDLNQISINPGIFQPDSKGKQKYIQFLLSNRKIEM